MTSPRGRFDATVPPTTDYTVVFPYNRYYNKFDTNFYTPVLTDGRLSFEQLYHFLSEIETILQKKARYMKAVLWTFMGVFIVGFLGLFFFISILDDSGEDVEDLLIAMFGYFIVVIIVAIIIQYHNRSLDREARNSTQALIDRNYQFFADQGLRWNLPQQFPRWIELIKDYRVPVPRIQPTTQQFYPYLVQHQPQVMQPHLNFQNQIPNPYHPHYQNNVPVHSMMNQQYQQANGQFYQPPVFQDNTGNFRDA